MTVSELMADLLKYPLDAEVLVTWEGTVNEPSVYQCKGGTVIIDADGDHYRKSFEDGSRLPTND